MNQEGMVLEIFRNYAQVLQIEKKNQEVQITRQQLYPFGVEIRHVVRIGSHLAVITNNCELLMTESTPPFKRVSYHKLYTGNTPTKKPIAYCAASTSGEYMVCCGFHGQAIVASYDSEDNPSLKTISLRDDFIIHSAIPTINPDIFAFLISTLNTKHKYIIKIDVNEAKLIEKTDVPEDSRELIAVFNGEGYAQHYLFTDTKFIAGVFGDKFEFDIPAPVASYFSNMMGELAFQLTNGQIFVCKPPDNSYPQYTITDRGKLPLISIFCPLPNDLLLCVAEHGDAFVIQISHTSGLSNSFKFDIFPKTQIPLIPVISHAQFVGRNMVVCSGVGQNTNIFTIRNTIPNQYTPITFDRNQFSRANCSIFTQRTTRPNELLQLFRLEGDITIVSTPKASVVISQNRLNIMSSRTIKAGIFNNENIQIHQKGIICFTSGKEWMSESEISCAEIGTDSIVIGEPGGRVALFDQDLKVKAITNIPGARCFCFCSDILAVASDAENKTATITLYSKDLTPSDNVLQPNSTVNSMVYIEDQQALFASAMSGTVYKYMFDNNNGMMNLLTQQILTANTAPTLIKFHESVLIVADRVFYFTGDELLAMRIDVEDIVAVAENPGNPSTFYALTKQERLIAVEVKNPEQDVQRDPFPVDCQPRRVIVDGNRAYVLCRSGKGTDFNSSIVVVDNDASYETLPTKRFERGIEITSIAALPNNNIVVCWNNPLENTWSLTKYDCTNPTNFQEVVTKKNPGLCSPCAITYLPSMNLLLYSKNSDHPTLYGMNADRPVDTGIFKLAFTAISLLTVTNNTVWCASASDRVFALKITMRDGKVSYNISAEAMPRQATAIVGLDDNSVAVGDKFGGITILRLSDDFAVDTPWKYANNNFGSIALLETSNSSGEYKKASLPIGRIDRVASFMVGEMVTSIMVLPKSNTVYYTTLLGQIGVLIPISNEEEFNNLASVETQTEKACSNTFGLMYPKAIDSGRMGILNCDMIEMLSELDDYDQERIANGLNIKKEWVIGLICRLKATAKF